MRGLARWGCVAVAAATTVASTADGQPAGFRPLTPGVLTVVPAPVAPPGSAASATDTVLHDDLLDITLGRADSKWIPLQAPAHTTFFARGRDREFARDIWNLEFAFKPPRFLDVDVPVAGLKMQRKRIWYLVYRVRNAGGRRPVIDAKDSARRSTEPFETPIRFVPQFVLESLEPLDAGEGLVSYRAYLDRVIPTALGPIREREAGGREILDSAAMVATEIGPSEERWGVATWEDIDPRIDFFSIYVRGLTNAFQWRRRPGAAIVATDPGAAMEQALRTLRLDFWRPGDDRDEVEEEMHVGFAGMFERMALGASLLEAVGESSRDAADPLDGLRALDLRWSDLELLEPKDVADPSGGDVGVSLTPLVAVLARLDAMPDPAARGAAVRALFGDVGLAAFEDIAKALAGPADAARDAERRAAMADIPAAKVSPETVADAPLASLATILRHLESQADLGSRRATATRLMGPAARRVEWLARRVAQARSLATLDAVDVLPADLAAGNARNAFDRLRPAIQSLSDERRAQIVEALRGTVRVPTKEDPEPPLRSAEVQKMPADQQVRFVADLLLEGLFGARGPRLFAAAAALDEGIDHSWVFRYETTNTTP